jgi:2'-5' RNA ligase
MFPEHETAQHLYDRLWASALDSYGRGEVCADDYLIHQATDQRSGLTLIARIPEPVQTVMMDFIGGIRQIVPDQYHYQPRQLHVTVLTLLPVTGILHLEQLPLAAYQTVFAEIFQNSQPFPIHFQGITATPEAVMIQGFPDPALNNLRETLRSKLNNIGLGDNLDVRYKLTAAHVTVMRFASTPPALPVLRQYLIDHRQDNFGTVMIRQIEFVHNDYYLSPDKTCTLSEYPLYPA